MKISNVKRNGKYNITVKCLDSSNARLLENHINQKFQQKVNVKSVKKHRPTIKIVRIYSDLDDQAIFNQILSQNSWIPQSSVKLIRVYKINLRNNQYSNILLETDLDTHNLILERGSVVFNLSQCRAFEVVDILQCNKCMRFGHISTNCVNDETCKFCAQSHRSANCENRTSRPQCINCLRVNLEGANYNTNHIATNERCPSRQDRIHNLKMYHAKN